MSSLTVPQCVPHAQYAYALQRVNVRTQFLQYGSTSSLVQRCINIKSKSQARDPILLGICDVFACVIVLEDTGQEVTLVGVLLRRW